MNGELFSKLKRFFPVSGAIYLHFWQICQNEMSLWCLIQCYQLSLSFWMYLVVRCCNYHSQIKHISFPTSFLRQYYYICSGHHEVYIIQPCWLPGYVRKALAYTAWKASKYGVFSGPYFSAFGLNTESYSVSQYLSVFNPNAGKYGPEKTPYLDTSRSVSNCNSAIIAFKLQISFLFIFVFTLCENIHLFGSVSKKCSWIKQSYGHYWPSGIESKERFCVSCYRIPYW